MELRKLSATQPDEVLMLFSNIIGARDEYTQGHSHHVAVIAEAIAKLVAPHLDIPRLVQAALFHDIGKGPRLERNTEKVYYASYEAKKQVRKSFKDF